VRGFQTARPSSRLQSAIWPTSCVSGVEFSTTGARTNEMWALNKVTVLPFYACFTGNANFEFETNIGPFSGTVSTLCNRNSVEVGGERVSVLSSGAFA
jgi:hypothetical protein